MTTLVYDEHDSMIGCWPQAAPAMRVGEEFESCGSTYKVSSVTHRVTPEGYRTGIKVHKYQALYDIDIELELKQGDRG